MFLLHKKIKDGKKYHSEDVQSKAIIENKMALIHWAVMSSAADFSVMLLAKKIKAPIHQLIGGQCRSKFLAMP